MHVQARRCIVTAFRFVLWRRSARLTQSTHTNRSLARLRQQAMGRLPPTQQRHRHRDVRKVRHHLDAAHRRHAGIPIGGIAADLESSPWPDMRFFGPIEDELARAEAQTHRRFFKTHLPLESLPLYSGVKFIHVARDGRDAAMSFHNHLTHFTDEILATADAISRSDQKFADDYPRVSEDAAAFFSEWVLDGGGQGDDGASFYCMENSYWAACGNPDVLLVHYNDLKADRAGEMRRIANFLEIDIAQALWPEIVAAASFEAMKTQGDALMPNARTLFDHGASRFLNKGTNGRWQNVFAGGRSEALCGTGENALCALTSLVGSNMGGSSRVIRALRRVGDEHGPQPGDPIRRDSRKGSIDCLLVSRAVSCQVVGSLES